MADVLTLAGHRSAVHLASATRWMIVYRMWASGRDSRAVTSKSEVLAVLHKHPNLGVSVRKSLGVIGPTISAVALVHYAATEFQGGAKKADKFVEVFTTGIPSRDGCPAHSFREYVLKHKTTKIALTRDATFQLLIRTWNAFALDQDLNKFYMPRGGDFIEIVGLDQKDLWVPPQLFKQSE